MSSICMVALVAYSFHMHRMATKRPVPKGRKQADEGKRQPPAGTRSALFYLPDDLLEALDAWKDAINAKGEGPQWSRSDLVKAVLKRAVDRNAGSGETP